MGRPIGLPFFHRAWRHMRQACIFWEQTLALVEENEFQRLLKTMSPGAHFSRSRFSVQTPMRRPSQSAASSSALKGMESAAPRRVTLMADALLARRMHACSGSPAIRPAMK